MSEAYYYDQAVRRLKAGDTTLTLIDLFDGHKDHHVSEMMDMLIARPLSVSTLRLAHNDLTDETGVKLARFVAASSSIETLDVSSNQLTDCTRVALAAALRVNRSLATLLLYQNRSSDPARCDQAFVQALHLNPDRPPRSVLRLYRGGVDDYARLKLLAERLGHPSMQALLLNEK